MLHIAARRSLADAPSLRRHFLGLCTAALAAVATACSSSTASVELPTWTFTPDLQIGGDADADDGLNTTKALLVTARGDIWVLDAQLNVIRVFDSLGALVRTIGRKGQGPGEFEWPDGMVRAPDGTVWVHDAQNGKFAILSETGALLRERSAPALGFGWLWTGGIDSTGRIYDRLMDRDDPLALRFLRTTTDSARADTVAVPRCLLPGDDLEAGYYVKRSDKGRTYSVTIPFAPRPVSAYDWRGGALWCAPRGDAYDFTRISLDGGDTLARIVRQVEAVPVTPAEREEAIDDMRKFVKRMGDDGDLDWSRIPGEKPRVVHAYVDDLHRLWVRTDAGDSTSSFDLFSADGKPIATATFPFRTEWSVTPVVRGDRVWLVARTEDDVPYVVRGRLGSEAP